MKMKQSGKLSVLHVLGGLWCGGTEAFVMNMFRSIDREKVQFDFLIHEKSKAHYDDEVLSLGGNIYRIPDRTEVGTVKYILTLVRILLQIKPDVIHAHAMFNAGVIMLASWLARIKTRVCHAHSSDDQNRLSLSRKMFRSIMRMCIYVFATHYAACSEKAAEYLFGEGIVKKGKVNLINNGIDVNKYISVTRDQTNQIRKELGVSDKHYVIGLVSRLVEVKNPLYIIKIFEQIREINQDALIVIVGEGPLKWEIEKELKKRNLTEHVRLTGNRSDVPIIMSAFDIFVLPSIFEGLGIVAIEAQARGLPCILSDGVSLKADLGLGLIKYISLNDENEWIRAITSRPKKLMDSHKIIDAFKDEGYDVKSASNKLLQVYGLS
ncbi:glycosyltransferase family 1 protein [Paenibacillus sp. RC67]|uniref:glycosyltransferase family 1 protein n=1 Tax=Paenibacillus sp. RC67 TaxID=3039392 RepID=UPI0024AE53D9|nr:glycosyltransferase family 1 protein [Paenibacillus sp. RC67]